MSTRGEKLLAIGTGSPLTFRQQLINQLAVQNVRNINLEATKLSQIILNIIKKGIVPNKEFSEATISALSQANTNNATVQKVLDLLAQLVKGPPVNKQACLPDSIGDAYYAGRKVGCVFGTPTNPIFNQSSMRGWKLVSRPSTGERMRFDFVKEKYISENMNLSKIIANLLKNEISGKNNSNRLANAEGRVGIGGFLKKLFEGGARFPKFGSFVLNPISLRPQMIGGVPIQWSVIRGYFIIKDGKILRVFQRGTKLYSENGEESKNVEMSENAKSRIASLIEKIKNLSQAASEAAERYLKAAREARVSPNKEETASRARKEALEAEKKVIEAFAELKLLYEKLFKEGGMNVPSNNYNAGNVSRYLYSSEFTKMSATARSRKLAELLKKYKPGSKARDIVKTRVLEEIRNAGQNRNAAIAQRRLANLRTNIGSALSPLYNRNLVRALGVEGSRAIENLRAEERRYGNERRRTERRYVNNNYGNRRRNRGGEPAVPVGPREYSNMAASALPMNQKTAITNAGGVQTALNTVASVPGGAIEVAKAAEALNETAGNVGKAVNVKGASPTAVQAVQKLGGPNNAVNVLHGLNTLSQKPSTLRRKAAAPRRPRKKPMKIRIAELNRVINAVKKQKLISLIAHNVTKTHNIHPNDEKKKKYYKKVIKSNILRTKFAKIVKKAARKP